MTAPKNPECPMDLGSIECLSAKWFVEAEVEPGVFVETGVPLLVTPCQQCPWWEEYSRSEE